MKTTKQKKAAHTLAQLVKAAHAAGVHVNVALESNQMPERFPNDPEPVTLLIEESERLNKLGNDWLNAKAPNQIAAQACFTSGWAHSVSAAWLRVKLNGELEKTKI